MHHGSTVDLIDSLMEDLSRERIEVDMMKLAGPAFAGVDNRLLSLQLVERGLTDAAMFIANGEVVQPSEVLYKKPILVERGGFRPATKLTLDLLNRALDQFLQEPSVREQKPVVLAEMTLRSLGATANVGHTDFLARADILGALGFDVLISRFEPLRVAQPENRGSNRRSCARRGRDRRQGPNRECQTERRQARGPCTVRDFMLTGVTHGKRDASVSGVLLKQPSSLIDGRLHG